MSILLIGLPVLAIIVVANLIQARGLHRARLLFNLLLFGLSAFLALAGLGLSFLPPDALAAMPDITAMSDIGQKFVAGGFGGWTLAIIGLWGMLACLRPVRLALARVLPALDPDSAVHTLALVAVGYLMGNAAVSLTPGALDALAETGFEATLTDVLAQQLVFVLVAFAGVGLPARRTGPALNERLGLARPTAGQIWTGIRWMVFFVLLQGCISATWTLFNAAEAEQLRGINDAMLGNFDTVWEWFLLAASAGLGEELLFRGALQPIFGILPTSLIFAVSHVQYGLTPATLAVFLLSIVLGIIRKRSNTTVAILVHAGYNFILGLLSLLALYLEPLAR